MNIKAILQSMIKEIKKNDLLAIIITFGTGFLAGIYLYVGAFAPSFFNGQSQIQSEDAYQELVVVGESYGGCEIAGACASFQMLADASFRYLGVTAAGSFAAPKEGVVPRSLFREIVGELQAADLRSLQRLVEPENCDSLRGGNDYLYSITFEGEEYVFDSCGTVFANESALKTALAKLWIYFPTTR